MIDNAAMDGNPGRRRGPRRRAPFMRLEWNGPPRSSSPFQSYQNEIQQIRGRALRITVRGAPTGGGAMLMEPGNCIIFTARHPHRPSWGMSLLSLPSTTVRVMEVSVPGIKAVVRAAQRHRLRVRQDWRRRTEALANGYMVHHALLAYDTTLTR